MNRLVPAWAPRAMAKASKEELAAVASSVAVFAAAIAGEVTVLLVLMAGAGKSPAMLIGPLGFLAMASCYFGLERYRQWRSYRRSFSGETPTTGELAATLKAAAVTYAWYWSRPREQWTLEMGELKTRLELIEAAVADFRKLSQAEASAEGLGRLEEQLYERLKVLGFYPEAGEMVRLQPEDAKPA